MKEKIKTAKDFICFYLALPLFVLMVLATGVGAVGSEVTIPAAIFIKEEKELSNPPSKIISGEISSDNGVFTINAKDLSKDYNILNATNKEVDEEELLQAPPLYKYDESAPMVLVVHTHGTECYSSEEQSFSTPDEGGSYGFYDSNSETRSTDVQSNMIAIGEAFCSALSRNGVSAIQCRIMHDKEDYNSSYANSRKSIEEYLEEFPSIKYVIDIHRDSLTAEDGTKTKLIAGEIEDCAQVMLVNGTAFDNWEDNLSLALKLKKAMDEKYPSLSRPIYLRNSKYNLDLTRGSLLLEVGTCANTFEEAKRAAELSAECFASVIKQGN
ncbi:MAG: stage II sporulation protein P [Clostridia bacterium]|nr:stage II sporulation protein P [Clostridia bacterium]